VIIIVLKPTRWTAMSTMQTMQASKTLSK